MSQYDGWLEAKSILGTHGRWACTGFTGVYQIEVDFEEKANSELDKMMSRFVAEME